MVNIGAHMLGFGYLLRLSIFNLGKGVLATATKITGGGPVKSVSITYLRRRDHILHLRSPA